MSVHPFDGALGDKELSPAPDDFGRIPKALPKKLENFRPADGWVRVQQKDAGLEDDWAFLEGGILTLPDGWEAFPDSLEALPDNSETLPDKGEGVPDSRHEEADAICPASRPQ
jgi:hypothetical protein